jgi:hypothetical protein
LGPAQVTLISAAAVAAGRRVTVTAAEEGATVATAAIDAPGIAPSRTLRRTGDTPPTMRTNKSIDASNNGKRDSRVEKDPDVDEDRVGGIAIDQICDHFKNESRGYNDDRNDATGTGHAREHEPQCKEAARRLVVFAADQCDAILARASVQNCPEQACELRTAPVA